MKNTDGTIETLKAWAKEAERRGEDVTAALAEVFPDRVPFAFGRLAFWEDLKRIAKKTAIEVFNPPMDTRERMHVLVFGKMTSTNLSKINIEVYLIFDLPQEAAYFPLMAGTFSLNNAVSFEDLFRSECDRTDILAAAAAHAYCTAYVDEPIYFIEKAEGGIKLKTSTNRSGKIINVASLESIDRNSLDVTFLSQTIQDSLDT